ncbi:GNAT family N-acetyltransferase [Polaromonas sp. CT11-55]|uniref:GNAT family N-acetyltransferase n=1 Tax=Polaromonas sp. CT11-55 TaxID=3243045 RepID=UPI0039A4A703
MQHLSSQALLASSASPAAGALSIRPCAESDMAAIQAIYAHYVATNLATFELEPPSVEQMRARRADILRGGYPYLVALCDGEVAGYAYGSAYRSRPAYRHTVEDSIYVAPGMRQAGVGSALLRELIRECEQRGFRQMVAVVGNSANTGSLRVHEAQGFVRVGTLGCVGYKFGQWVDTVLMQRALGDGAASPGGLPPPALQSAGAITTSDSGYATQGRM